MKLKFLNSAGSVNLDKRPPVIQKAIAFLDSLENDTVVTLRQVADELGVSHNYITHSTYLFDGYKIKIKNQMWYGNQKTIAAAKKEFNKI